MPLWTALALLALLLPRPPLHAQGSTLPPGTRVRMHPDCGPADTERSCKPVVGRVVPPAGDGSLNGLLIEAADGARHRIDLSPGTRLERSGGYRRHTLLGLGIGSLVGLGAGAALTSGCKRGGSDDELCGLNYVYAVPAGAAVGALIGALSGTERWEAVSMPWAPALHLWPQTGGTAVALSVRF